VRIYSHGGQSGPIDASSVMGPLSDLSVVEHTCQVGWCSPKKNASVLLAFLRCVGGESGVLNDDAGEFRGVVDGQIAYFHRDATRDLTIDFGDA